MGYTEWAEAYNQKERPLVPGVIRGWRAFMADGPNFTPSSLAFTYNYCCDYISGDWLTARCKSIQKTPLEKIPDIHCRCGFYAAHTFNSLEDHILYSSHEIKYVGVVEGAGRVIVGSLGWRAAKQRLVALAPAELKAPLEFDPAAFYFAKIRTSSGPPSPRSMLSNSPVVYYDSVEELQRNYPNWGGD